MGKLCLLAYCDKVTVAIGVLRRLLLSLVRLVLLFLLDGSGTTTVVGLACPYPLTMLSHCHTPNPFTVSHPPGLSRNLCDPLHPGAHFVDEKGPLLVAGVNQVSGQWVQSGRDPGPGGDPLLYLRCGHVRLLPRFLAQYLVLSSRG